MLTNSSNFLNSWKTYEWRDGYADVIHVKQTQVYATKPISVDAGKGAWMLGAYKCAGIY
jgi:hypothetical protein